ncbi:MAG: hypothetical protein COZ06_18180 [Armatimonadetes bacterium CG_4_10_14_3_um_filter_66_18]|nr:hypothetical protein [Armatimonadota bacterium]OIO96591.1 MAG: hypothetical protein AUJ96_24530 [Armatimonadetes bacterium CG2_30_66_41]PIU67335.1 MAG: hypothetical protein COS85_01100 [Armatimonadetes bacterium CG07_land_8_20_14_0_80_59_28]PIU94508.1 MAG: hypothetical protein COS65_07255 [Armatimonadetes bacterium CG06_land_8_20_14_3_00_66_21]PIX43428.1 MAG: hypothetical protein COZ57_19250 [Armatimonadetes bacterium CG_4_8_14_3_um_filter_66_20]PIY46938.1 MAG: hypothetical protein COZ06_18
MATDNVTVTCSQCGKQYPVPRSKLGQKGKCSCGNVFVVQEPTVVERSPSVCSNCGSVLESAFRFCPACGAQRLTSASDPSDGKQSLACELPSPPASGLTVDFQNSSSANFPAAFRHASNHHTFATYQTAAAEWHRVTYDCDEVGSLLTFWELSKGQRNRLLYVDGSRTEWNTVFHFLRCYREREKSLHPPIFCFGNRDSWKCNLWGCIQAKLSFSDWADWLCWGKLSKATGSWVFDKDSIRKHLQHQLFPYRYCPALDQNWLAEVLSAFPDSVNPGTDARWKYRRGDYDLGNGPILGVTIASERAGHDIVREILERTKTKPPLERALPPIRR